MILTKEQRKAVKQLYDRNPDGSSCYKEFRKRFHYGVPSDHIIIQWRGLWVGIEENGYTHS